MYTITISATLFAHPDYEVTVTGSEAAFAVFEAASVLAEATGAVAALWDSTGELLDHTEEL